MRKKLAHEVPCDTYIYMQYAVQMNDKMHKSIINMRKLTLLVWYDALYVVVLPW